MKPARKLCDCFIMPEPPSSQSSSIPKKITGYFPLLKELPQSHLPYSLYATAKSVPRADYIPSNFFYIQLHNNLLLDLLRLALDRLVSFRNEKAPGNLSILLLDALLNIGFQLVKTDELRE